MRDGHRAAARDLLAEARDHAAGAAEHVAEAHEHELRAAALQALADHLGEALGRAHHVGRIDRLVGGHQHELLDPRRDRRARQHARAVGVVAHRLPRVGLLHQRHVLVRRRRGRRRAGCSRASTSLDQRRVLDVADDRHQRQLRERVGERRLDLVERGFGDVEQHEPRGTEARDLAAQLGADRPARAGHHHHAIAEPFAEARAVEHDGIAPEQVVELDVADRGEREPAADQVLVRRARSAPRRPRAAHSSATRRRTT